jgi:two-component system chemotaxis sensor kinase CheA
MRTGPARRPITGAIALSLAVALFAAPLSWVWRKTQSVNPHDHQRIDAAFRELRSLDRTINQDVVRARYKLTPNYDLVLHSYRRINDLEVAIATPPRFLTAAARARYAGVVREYGAAVTHKQRLIETIKYRTAELNELLDYLPDAGVDLAQALTVHGDLSLGENVHHLLETVLLYNLTSDEHFAPVIKNQSGLISSAAEHTSSPALRRRVRALLLDVQRLMRVKPEVNQLFVRMFDEPIIDHENAVGRVYYAEYYAAEKAAAGYRLVLYVLCVGLAALIGYAVHRLRQTARALAASNERLEERVVERTRDLRAVLDNVEEALIRLSLDGRLLEDPSAAFNRWFPNASPGAHLWEILARFDPEYADWLALGWEQLSDGLLPPTVALAQLPVSFSDTVSHRRYRINYRPIGDAQRPEHFLVVIADVTAEIERQRHEAEQQDQVMLFERVMIEGAQFETSFIEMERLVNSVLRRDHEDRYAFGRSLHTIKGNAAMLGLSTLTNLCHELESRMEDEQRDPTREELERLSEAWAALARRARTLLRMAQSDRLSITKTDLADLRHAVSAGGSPAELLHELTYMEREPVARRFELLAGQARHIAERLGKGDVAVHVEADGLRLDGQRWAPFWAAFVHLLRNALDHGIEAPDERRRAGKPATGHLTLAARNESGQVVIEVADDGRGIDWDRLRAKAAARGIAASTTDELAATLLEGGLSTKTEATLYSGRGAGLSACHRACRALGGTIHITSTPGRGTTFRLTIPGDDAPPVTVGKSELRVGRA